MNYVVLVHGPFSHLDRKGDYNNMGYIKIFNTSYTQRSMTSTLYRNKAPLKKSDLILH